MKAFILAAGLGSRLKPWTLSHPKALVPVQGAPMLQRIIEKLTCQGFNNILINVHHFAEQIIDFLDDYDAKAEIAISDERMKLLDTGGAILHAASYLTKTTEPVLVHNVDILSNADCVSLVKSHSRSNALATLLVSKRQSSRMLAFDSNNTLCGWINVKTGEVKGSVTLQMNLFAFSGIHVVSNELILLMQQKHKSGDKFSIIDFYLSLIQTNRIKGYIDNELKLIDIGKPETLEQSQKIILS